MPPPVLLGDAAGISRRTSVFLGGAKIDILFGLHKLIPDFVVGTALHP